MILAVNCYSVNLATNVQNIFTAAKLVAIAIIVGGGAYKLILGNASMSRVKPMFTQELLPIIIRGDTERCVGVSFRADQMRSNIGSKPSSFTFLPSTLCIEPKKVTHPKTIEQFIIK